MMGAIALKEWVKLRPTIISFTLISFALIAILAYQTHTLFMTSEPESLLWHRFVFFDTHPHGFLKWIYLLVGFLTALFQFYTERYRGRILVHLPMNPWFTLGLHQLIGVAIIALFGLIIGIGLWVIFMEYYPNVLLHVSLIDNLWFLFCALFVYLGSCAVIMEPKQKVMLLKALFLFLALGLLISADANKNIFLWTSFIVVCLFLGIDSILAISNKRVKNPIFYALLIVSIIAIGWLGGKELLNNAISKRVHYYPFYSNKLKTFVYQRNLGGHNFEYGTIKADSLSYEEFKDALPFVYWRDLQTQGRLPVVIDGKSYDAPSIKKERLSLSYKPTLLTPPRVALYPLFNPDPKVGIIPFPKEALYISKKGIVIYHHHGEVDKRLTSEVNLALNEEGFVFPAKKVWGKFTNLKPYDLGLFITDAKDKLFQLIRYNDTLHVKQIFTPQTLVYLHVSENAAKKIVGYAIGKNSEFYLLKQDGFSFVKLDLPNFDYKKMDLQFLSDPLHYIVRYNDENSYFIRLFKKDFTPVDFAKLEKNAPPVKKDGNG